MDEARDLDRAAMCVDCVLHLPGVGRQPAAILASGSRTPRLASIWLPSPVIQGKADPLMPLA
jgi:hypothetical protein